MEIACSTQLSALTPGFQATFDSLVQVFGWLQLSNYNKESHQKQRVASLRKFPKFSVICSFSIIFSDGDATEVQTHSSLGKTSYHCGFFPTIQSCKVLFCTMIIVIQHRVTGNKNLISSFVVLLLIKVFFPCFQLPLEILMLVEASIMDLPSNQRLTILLEVIIITPVPPMGLLRQAPTNIITNNNHCLPQVPIVSKF